MKEPIKLHLKTGRGGIGLSVGSEKLDALEEERKTHVQELESNFKGRLSNHFLERKVFGQLKHALDICIQLDCEKEVTDSPFLLEFQEREAKKKAREQKKEEEEEEEEEEPPLEVWSNS